MSKAVKVSIPRRELRKFYREAKKYYPRENYAACLGYLDAHGVLIIDRLSYPTDAEAVRDENFVRPTEAWRDNMVKEAALEGLLVVGAMHTHCYDMKLYAKAECSPSEEDYTYMRSAQRYWSSHYTVMGIAIIVKTGEKVTCRHKFWPVVPAVTTKIV